MSSLGGGPPLDEGDLPVATPEPVDVTDKSRVGTDEWVSQAEGRRTAQTGLSGVVARAWERLPAPARLVILIGPFAIFPFITNEGNLYRYGLITIIYALLALGLNVVVGFAGLLDLGYVAFFGFGAYLYGIMASGHSGHHLQAEIAIPIVVVATALLGLLLGLTSWRLLGDYLAIVTLFFLQAFVIFVNNANGGLNDFSYPFVGKVDLTGGANGLDQIDPFNLFGFHITTTKGYYFFTLISLTLLMIMLYFVNGSRTGRAWRALREDPLAAEDDDGVDRDQEAYVVVAGKRAGLNGAEDRAGESRRRRAEHEGEQLQPVDRHAHHLCRQRVLAQRAPGPSRA